MAITITKSPTIMAGVNDNIIFEFSTDNISVVYFSVKVYKYSDNTLMNKYNLFIPPTGNSSHINISSLLKSYTKIELNATEDLHATIPNACIDYYIKVEGLNNSGAVIDAQITSEKYTAISASFDVFNNENASDYIVNGVDKGRFLTSFNDNYFQDLNINQTVFAYYFTDEATIINQAEIMVNDDYSLKIPITAENGINRLMLNFHALLSGVYTEKINKIEVSLLDIDNSKISAPLFFKIKNDCKNLIDVVSSNKFGGFDSFGLNHFSLQLAHAVTKTKMLGYNSTNYKLEEKIINVVNSYQYTVTTDVLNTNQYLMLSNQLISATDVFIQIENHLIPITITTSNINTFRKNKNTKITFNFTVDTNSLMLLVQKQNNGNQRDDVNQLNFILNQFWSLVDNNKGIEII